MRRMFPSLLTAVAVVILPQFLAAQEAGRPGPPGPPDPERFFKQLDGNQDGTITADEIRPGMPERMKALLKRADKNDDGKVSQEELREAMKGFRPDPPGASGRGDGPGFRRGEFGFGSGAGGPGGGYGFGFRAGGRGPGDQPAPPGGPPPQQQPGPPQAGPPGKPDLKALFGRMDKDKDGKLGFEEFSEGMKELHKDIAARLGGLRGGPRPGGPMGWGGPHRGPMPGGPMGWGGPHRGPMPGGPMGWGGPDRGPMPGGPMGWWRHAARLPLPPFALGPHFGAIYKRTLEGVEKAKEHGRPEDVLRRRTEAPRGPWQPPMRAGEARKPGVPGPDVRKPFDPRVQYAERSQMTLQRVERQLVELDKKVKALEAKLGAAQPPKGPPKPDRHEQKKPKPRDKD